MSTTIVSMEEERFQDQKAELSPLVIQVEDERRLNK
jgi:hypothetical protein